MEIQKAATMKKLLWSSAMLILTLPIVGCGDGELGPANPEDIPAVDPAEVQEQLTRPEVQQHMPPGVQIPQGSLPQGASGAPAGDSE